MRLNGVVRQDPEWPVHLEKDRIAVDGCEVVASERVYLMLNKPRGVVTTASDEKGRSTVYHLLDASSRWVAPVGRLDKASEGLLLLTNDSEWSQRLLDPASHVEKTYHVQIATAADQTLIGRLRAGVTDQGERLRARSIQPLREGATNSWLEIVLDEGKNRHIRRMLAACGAEVLRLVRIAIGPVVLGELEKGSFRALSSGEKKSLDDAMKRNLRGSAAFRKGTGIGADR